MKLLNVIFINLLLTIAEILSADERCALQNVHGEAIHITHPTDCRKFYKCDELHNIHEEICPSGLEYDPHLKVCVYNNSGFCMINSTKTVQSVYNCSSFEDGFTIPNYDDNCRSYVECSNGISKIEICENGQVYDSLKGDCIPKNENFKCEKIQKSLFQISNVLKSDNITFYPNFDNQCKSYIKCNSNKCKEIFCENNKLFNAASNTCEDKTKVVCDQLYRKKRNVDKRVDCLNKNISKKCINGEYQPDDCSCRSFYLCVMGTWRLQTCKPDRYFSKKDNFCIPDDGSCEEECHHGAYKEDDDNCAQYYICVYGKWRPQTCSIYQYFDKTVNYCVPDINNICPNTRTTTKPNCNHGEYKEIPDDCTGFHLCVSGIWRLQYCRKDQYFNPKLNYCVPEDGTCRPTTLPTPSTPPTKPPVCIHGEYKEYSEDCTGFNLCVHGQWRIQFCNNGQYFNTKLNYCVPEDGTCRPTTLPTPSTPPTKPPVCIHGEYKEYPEDCTGFNLCVLGQWRIQFCNNGQYFNTKLNYCVPEDGTCRPTTLPTPSTPPTKPPVCIHGEYKEYPEDCTGFNLCVHGQWRIQFCNNGQYFNTKLNYCVPEDGTCRPTTLPTPSTPPTKPPVCIHGEYKEYPEDCTGFKLCVLGQWRIQFCNNGQYFNTKLNYCVPEDGTCRPTTLPTSTTQKPECLHGQYRPHKDCTRFEICVLGFWRLHSCSPNQYFNKIKNYCVPEDGSCRPTKPTTPTTPTTRTTPTTPTTRTTPTAECIAGEYRAAAKCTQFELCVLGYWRLQSCGNNKYFNKKKNYCIPEDGSCRPTIPTTVVPTTTECITGEYRATTNCIQFELCVNGYWRLHSCGHNKYFDKTKNYCVPEDGSCRSTTTTTTTTTKPKPECLHGEYKEDFDCTKFWLCVNGHWRKQSCSHNQYFDTTKNYCVPEDGSCRSTTTTSTTTTKPTTTTERTTTTTTPKPECLHGEFKDHSDCTKFWLCVSGRWREQSCSHNQYFDKNRNYCIPEDGSCRSTTTTSTTTTKPTTTTTEPTTTTTKSTTTTTKPTTTTTEKPECPHGEFKEHYDCTKFWLCVNGRWREQSCPHNQYFDKNRNYCIPEDGSCRSTTTTSTTTTKPTTTTTEPTTTTTTTKSTTTTTTEKPECPHGEFKVHYDCTKFWLCVSGRWREQSCPHNQYFDKNKNYCVPEDGSCRSTTTTSTTTTKPTTTTTEPTTTTTTEKPECPHGEFKEHYDCTKFWLCVSGRWREQTCPHNQYFDKNRNYCVPEDGSCRSTTTTSTTTTKPTTTTTEPTTTTTKPTTTTTKPTTTTTTEKPECPHGEFKEHYDCTKFWLCVSGRWREQSCPHNQYFDKIKNYCVPEDGSCRSTTTTSTTTTKPTTTTTKPTTTTTTTTAKPTTTTTTEKPECPHGEFKEHFDCTKFWLCVSGRWREQSCPHNQYFDKTKNYCVPEDGSCRSTTTTSTTTTTTTTKPTTTTTKPTTTTTKQTTTTTTEKPECPHGEFKDHYDCTKFWLCVSGRWREQSCPHNQYFDKNKNYCVPEDGSCRSTTTTSTTTTKPTTTTTEPTTTTTKPTTTTTKPTTTTTTEKPECPHGEFKEHYDCTKFWLCVSGRWREQTCPHNQYFDKNRNYCVPEDGSCRSTTTTSTTTTKPTTTTTEPTTTTTKPTTTTTKPTTTTTTEKPECPHGEFKEHYDCTKFWLCVSGRWREQSCPHNQYFDKIKNYCVPEDGSCRSTTTTSTTTTKPTTTTTKPTTTTTTTTAKPTTTTTTEKPECPHGEFKEHFDCTKFWLCVSGRWREQSCPHNQYFDKTKNYCVPEDGSCRSTTTTSTTTTTTTTKPTTTTTKPTTTTTKQTTTTTTEKPECPHGEFKDHYDCTKFWLCVSGRWREQSCPHNQYFDKNKNYCVPEDGSCRSTTTTSTTTTKPTTTTTEPTTTTTKPTTTTTKPTTTTTKQTTTTTTEKPECPHGEFKDHYDCTKFWLCVSGRWREQPCPHNQYFDKTKNYCVPEDGSCRSTTTTSTTTTKPTTTTTKPTTTTTTTTAKPTTTTTTEKPECPHGEFKEHFDCTKFWLCVSGRWREQSCPHNQYFDKTKNYCVPEDGSCRSTTTTSTTTTKPTTTTTKPTTTTTTTTAKPITTTTTEKPECPHGEFKEHFDCTKFWLCVSGRWREQSCPHNQYFDKTKNYCVPEDGSCRSTTTTSTTTTTTTTKPTTTTTKPTTTTTKQTTTTTTEKPECPHGEFKDHYDCTKFWLCVSGRWREQSCPHNQYFDKTKNYCVPEDGSCRSTTTTSTTTTKPTTTTTTTTTAKPTTTTTTEKPECPHGEFKEHFDCTKFWLCVSGRWREQSCPHNQYFDKIKNYCVPEDGSCRSTTTTSTTTTKPTTTTTTTTTAKPTTTTTTEKPECPHGEFKEHFDCTKFWLCVSGRWREQSCPHNQYFDKTKNYCVPEDGSCRSTTTTSTTTTKPTTTTTKRTTTTTTTTAKPTTTTTTEKPECPHGEFKEHFDCTKFWLCVSGRWREQSCPHNQYFDKIKNYCVPEDGSCRSTTTTSTTTTKPTTTTTKPTTTTTTTTAKPTTTTTTEKPECPHGEFKEHFDCTKFWLCVSGRWREQSCPHNQYFDKIKNYCVPEDGSCRSTTTTSTTTTSTTTTKPTTTTTKPTTTTTTTTAKPTTTTTTEKPECPHGEFKEHFDCTKFWLCVSGRWREQSCPHNQYFDKTKNYCVPEDGSCRSTTTTSTTTTKPTTTTTKPTTTTTTTAKPTTTTTTEKPECPHGEFKEHFDCTKFWLCVSGRWREQSCPHNQYFDKTKNYCVPEDGSCRSTTTTSTTTTKPTTTTTKPTTTTTTTTAKPTTTTTTEKPECPHGEFKEHFDCTKFWLCVSGRWREQSCPHNQYFDKTKNYCVPEDGSCRSTTTTSTTTTKPTTTTTKPTTTTTTTTAKPTTTTTTEKPECPHGEFKEHFDCTKFWLCVSGRWREQSCPHNQYFDKIKNYCVPEDGSCRSTTTTSTTTTKPTTTTTKPTTTTTTTTAKPTTTTTTEKPECPHGEFKEHFDCTKFWLCVSGRWREQSCPHNQYFDKIKNYCVPEDGSCRSTTTTSTTTTKPTTTTTTAKPTTTTTTEKPECPHGEFKEHFDCTKFWLCVSGRWREQSCPHNQYFDKTKNYCVPEDGSCRSTTTTSTTTTKPTTTTTKPTTTTTTTTAKPTTTTTTEKPECPHGEFKEHFDCTKFWLCVSGRWREQSCPHNQYFDKTKNYCVPEDGSCRSTTTTSTTTTKPTTTTTKPTTTTTTTTAKPTTTTTTEKPECPHGEFKEHFDCTKFWLCVSGRWREQSCPHNQYFDKIKNYCVPEDGSCRSTTTTSTTTTKPTTTTTKPTTTTTTTTAKPTTTTTTEKPECPHGEFKEHFDCTKFWLCVSGRWREQSCPHNQYFDKIKNYCVPEDGSCRSTTTTSTTTTKPTTTTTTTTTAKPTTTTTTEKPECSHGEFKEHFDCTKFWLCVSGRWREQSCPHNQYFDKTKNYCVPEDGSCRSTTTTSTTTTKPTTTTTKPTTTTTTTTAKPTTTTTTEKPECPHGEFKEHFDCTKFWLCVSGRWREQSCPHNQYFDKIKNYCVPEDGSCRSTTTTSTTTTKPTTTTKRTTTTTTTIATPTTTTTTEKPECPHGEFKEHSDCTKFWLCVSGRWREQSCPHNQYFDKTKNYCVPEDGSCRSTTTTSTTTTKPTTTTTKPTTTTTTTTAKPTTTTTTEKPECPHGEFKEHFDCTKFWLCVSGRWREQSCPHNQYFDKTKNYCVPEDGSCRPTTTTSTTTTKPTTTTTTEKPECPHGEFKEHFDCTKFWLCVSGRWREQSCPHNQYFDKTKNYCVPEDGSCRSTTTTSTTTTKPTTTTTKPTTTTTTTTAIPITTTTTEKPECPHGEFKEHSDCTKFWLCVSGRWREQSCPHNQYFDKTRNYCVPEDGSCRSTTTTSTTTTKPTTTTTKPTTTTTTTTAKPTTTTTTEKPECPHGEFKEHFDCTKFWLCVVGQWREQSCSNGQYFNKDKNYCVPEDGSCRSTTRTIQPTPITTPMPQCRHGEYREYPDDCTKFFLCVVGRWTTHTCSDGQYFNPKLNYCVPEDGSCRPTKPTVIPTVTTPKPMCRHGEYKEYLEDCTKFYLCVLGIWRAQVCSNDQYFNPNLNYCVPEDGSCRPTKPTVIPTVTTPKPMCIHGEYKEFSRDCTKFYLCVLGIWREQVCSNDQYFDAKLNYCVPEDGSCRPTKPTIKTTFTTLKSKCIHGEYRENPEDCTKFHLCVSGAWRNQDCSNGQYFNRKLNYCVPEDGSCRPTPKPKCIHGQYKENLNDCTKFYLCVSGEWRNQNCSYGQYFNTKLNYCVPEDGSCRPTPKPKCIHGQYKEDSSDCTKFYLCVSGEWRNQGCSKTQYFNKKFNYCVPEDGSCRPTPKPKCIHGQYKEDSSDCTKFYLCVSGEWRNQLCPNNNYFNKNLNYCIPEDGTCRSNMLYKQH